MKYWEWEEREKRDYRDVYLWDMNWIPFDSFWEAQLRIEIAFSEILIDVFVFWNRRTQRDGTTQDIAVDDG